MNMQKEDSGNVVRCGREITPQELEAARQTVKLCSGLSRRELAHTVCEHWGWVTATGAHKVTACLKVLEDWERKGRLQLPVKRVSMRRSGEQLRGETPARRIQPGPAVVGALPEVKPVELQLVSQREQIQLWNEYVDRYHYLGYRKPFGCFLRYFVVGGAGLLGCVLMAGAAKAIRVRDEWIGWSRSRRERNLPWVINNTRFLIFHWVQIRHLASHILGQVAQQARADWARVWGYKPLLMETFVDPALFAGTSYRAAGWIDLGWTTGQGLRRPGRSYSSTPKQIYVKELAEDSCRQLRGGVLRGRAAR